jgi:hypothetical protein
MMEQNKVYSIKLISGEELISRVKQEGGVTELIKPRAVGMGPQGFAMMPWMMSSPDSNVIVSDTVIMGATETSQMVANQYIKQVTGIEV